MNCPRCALEDIKFSLSGGPKGYVLKYWCPKCEAWVINEVNGKDLAASQSSHVDEGKKDG